MTVGFFDEPIRAQTADARKGILHLLRNHRPSDGAPSDLVDLTERYLRLNPDDAEVRSALAKLGISDRVS
jgi:hypothetical protein